ncbi:integrase/recombinase xerD homolog [Montipora foliosa]|uniref:integrase/recombinase xerD homolog n=1 Tax=Montipora foliosa TaxID=591990 RepID=UPI0035F2136F
MRKHVHNGGMPKNTKAMSLALESGPPLVAVGILLFRNWRTNRQQSRFPRRLELSILTEGRLLDGRSLPLPKGEIEAFPAKTEHVALYLQHLLDSTQSYSVVDSAIYAIQWAHNLAGFPSPVDAPIIRDIRKAAKKMNGAHVVSRKQAVTADMIGTLVSASNLSNLLDLRNVCIFVLAFAGFFRINDVLHMKYGDVRFQSGYVAIDVSSSKTDQLRKGSEVVIASGSSIDTCPVNILRRYLQ